ncbi:hypothetical protein Tco_1130958 [Tanacetum coccineum]
MDDPNLTMEEYIRLEEEKAHKRGKVFNWQTATYGKIRVDDDLHNLSSVEAEFPAIVINDAVAPQDELQCKSQVSTPVNDEIDFRISFDESDDEDYTILFDKNSFSYKMIFVNDLKKDSENDNEKFMPSIPSPKPAISCFDDLDFFTDFENEFPMIVYNDAQTSKSNLLTEPILNPQHINEFDLNDKTSLSEYDDEEQNILYFNDLFPFNIIRLDNLKSEKDNDNNMALPPREQRHRFLRYEGLEYPDTDIVDFEGRLARIHRREVHRVPVFDFGGLPDLMAEGLSGRMLMEHRDEAGISVFTSRAWRRMLDIRGSLVHEFILEFFSMFRFGQAILDLDTPGNLQFQLGGARRRMSWRQFILALGLHTEEEMQTAGDFLGTSPSYTLIRDHILRLCHRLIACSIAGRSQAPKKEEERAHISGGQFVARLATHFGLLTAEILGGLTIIAPELPIIDMTDLVRLQIFAEDAPIINEGGQVDPAPEQAPQQPPPPSPAAAKTIPQRLERLEEDVQGLCRDVGSLRGLVERSMTDQGRFSTWMMTCMTQLMDASGLTYQALDGTF